MTAAHRASQAIAIGMRAHRDAHGRPVLLGTAHCEFVVPAGARFRLVRQQPADTESAPAFVIVVAPPDPRGLTQAATAKALRDNVYARTDPRDAAAGESPW